ncbi:hypothetical protein H072_6381 [Dactylellina haptotyla CBS 200.50]|uniref:C2H2-type domain-containing protein n=1 Tax=Dactylellina haptotyla (strain CBS 200.50) TaxID=1284197 RepID=S8AAC1_DACHA|nr:hypothetical protein H072_6381 [Dactylellina haptotyla CBS 200.50]
MEGLGNADDGLMLNYPGDGDIVQLQPEDFDIDTWLANFVALQGANTEQLAPAEDINNSAGGGTTLEGVSTGLPAYDLGPAAGPEYLLTNGQNDLLSFIEAFPFTSQDFAGYQLQPQLPLPEVGDVPSLSAPSPLGDQQLEIPEQSVILERYVNASSEDESEAPFSAIERHLERLGSHSPVGGYPSPLSMEHPTYAGFEKTEYDSSSTKSNSSNVSLVARATCLRELGSLALEEAGWTCQDLIPSRTPSIRSFRSSSSIASETNSIRTTSTSSRAPSRRKRTMTNNHKVSRKTSKSENRFFCTFCGTSFSTKSTWKRHEESIHLMLKTWTCSPHGACVGMPTKNSSAQKADSYRTCWFCSIDKTVVNVPYSFGQSHNLQQSRDVPDKYTSMTCFSLEQHCFAHAGARTCHENSRAEKTFIRFDHFARHLRDAHNLDSVKSDFEGKHDAPDDPLREVFQMLPGPQHSRCGFCGETFTSWSDRVHHVSHEFWWKKRRMEDWTGDWGFDPEWMDRLQDARLPEDFCSVTTPGSGMGDGDVKMQVDPIKPPSTPLIVPELCKPLVSIMGHLENVQQEHVELGRPLSSSNRTGRFPCTVEGCHKAFCLRKDLQRHHRTIHATKKPEFLCPVPECKSVLNFDGRPLRGGDEDEDEMKRSR